MLLREGDEVRVENGKLLSATHHVVRYGVPVTVVVEIGTRFYFRKETREVVELSVQPRAGWHPEPRARLSPKARGEGKPKEHWTDWICTRALSVHAELLEDGDQREDEPRRTRVEIIEAAADEARAASVKTKALTPQRRIQNRITTLRHKLRHPEKHGRSEWNPTELKEIEKALADAEAERASMKAEATEAPKPKRRKAPKKELA